MVPEKQNGLFAWQLLHREIVGALPYSVSERISVLPSDLDESGVFGRFAGMEHVRSVLRMSEGEADIRPAILVVGLFPAPSADAVSPRERAAAALLEWTGAGYLRYGFDRKELILAAKAAIRGARQTPPYELVTTVGDVRRRTSEVRHWLENRLRNVDGTRNALDAVLRGEATLHVSHLDPVAAASESHRDMIERLWTCSGPVARMAPEVGGLGTVRDMMTAYEHCWGDLERARAALRTAPDAERNDRLTAMRERLLAVRDALAEAIGAMDVLDGKLSAGNGA